jgi:hypothetical protein
MRRFVRALATGAALAGLALPMFARAEEKDPPKDPQQELQKKVDALAKELAQLKQQTKRIEDKSLGRWLSVGGDYRFRFDSLYGSVANYYQFTGTAAAPAVAGYDTKNGSLMTNRFGLNLKAKATQDVTITSRLLMYKTFGMQTADATNAGFFADRSSVMDGTIGHIPLDSTLRVDQVFATWSNIGGQPVWFSVGRRPSTGGAPTQVRQNGERPTSAGVPGLLVDYAFDGMTLGYAPEVEALPGAFAKICYGRGFEAGYNSRNSLSDTDMLGVQLVPVDTDPLRIDVQWNRGFNIFDNPNSPGNQLGDIDWYGVDLLSTLKRVGPGNLTLFASGGLSVTHPNGKGAMFNGAELPAGLLWSASDPGGAEGHTGWSVYVGARYDLPFGTKVGAEYNHGSKYWMPFDPAADDMWTSKLGTRGNTYEAYVIQELPLQAISSHLSKVFFRIGYQYYDFQYTGSNSWIGSPVKISELMATPYNAQMLPPVRSAHDVYGTFEVHL